MYASEPHVHRALGRFVWQPTVALTAVTNFKEGGNGNLGSGT